MTRIATAPPFAAVDANGPDFRRPLGVAIRILGDANTRFGIYSHHSHPEMRVGPDQVIFVQPMGGEPSKLLLTPLDRGRAARFGKPSTWSFTSGVNHAVAMRYSANTLHDNSGIDVESASFRQELEEVGDRLAAAGVHSFVEVTIDPAYLFVPPPGYVTREDTIGIDVQMLTFVPAPDGILAGNWRSAACWMPGSDGQPVVTGICVTGLRGRHEDEGDGGE